MNRLFHILTSLGCLFHFFSCAPPVDTGVEEEAELEAGAIEPVGYYREGPTDLWVREDSIYILRTAGGGVDVPSGRFGTWDVLGNRLDLDMGPDHGYQYRFVQRGLRRMTVDGPGPAVLDRTGPDRDGHMPVMRIIGAYRSVEGSHMFTPCGTDKAFPLGVGTHFEELADLHTEAIRSQALPVYIEIDAHIAPGPAMEGDEEDEYLWLERVGEVLPEQRCPF